jgi:FkbM family methyltransferase
VTFWWSYFPPVFDPTKRTFDYRGSDVDDLLFLCRFLRPGMCFFDIGAYHGLYAIVAGRRTKGKVRTIMFEPAPRERKRIHVHLRLNGLHATVEPFALSSQCGKRAFFLVLSGFTSMNSLTPPPTDFPVREMMVDTTTLDAYCHEHSLQQVDLVKIDVEGAEMELFKGAQWFLTSVRPLIICEILDWVTQPWGYQAREIVSSLQQHDYRWFEFAPDGWLMPHEQREEYPEVKNYLAVPGEKLTLISSLLCAK